MRLSYRSAAMCAVFLVGALAGRVEARNEHCAGGIQYVVGGLKDKQKGNTDDYLRQMNKAVQQLQAQIAQRDAGVAWIFAVVGALGSPEVGRVLQRVGAGDVRRRVRRRCRHHRSAGRALRMICSSDAGRMMVCD